jgi:hypothetical protein
MRPGNFKPLPPGPSSWSLFSLAWKLLIRSYTSTLQKQGLSVWEGLVSVFTGDVLMPNFNP